MSLRHNTAKNREELAQLRVESLLNAKLSQTRRFKDDVEALAMVALNSTQGFAHDEFLVYNRDVLPESSLDMVRKELEFAGYFVYFNGHDRWMSERYKYSVDVYVYTYKPSWLRLLTDKLFL